MLALEARRGLWEASGGHLDLGSIWDPSVGGIWGHLGSGKHLGSISGASGTHLGGIWGDIWEDLASVKHLRSIWEASGKHPP